MDITGEQKLLALLAHLAYFLGGIGLVIAPLAIFILKKDDVFVYNHAKQALVAQLVLLASTVLVWLLSMLFIGILLIPVLVVLWLGLTVTSVIAAIKVLNGEEYRYPFIQGLVEKV